MGHCTWDLSLYFIMDIGVKKIQVLRPHDDDEPLYTDMNFHKHPL